MRIRFLSISLLIVLIGCSSQKAEERNSTTSLQRASDTIDEPPTLEMLNYDGIVSIEVSGSHPELASRNDPDIIAKIPIEYAPESDVVKNSKDLEPSKAVSDLMEKPFVGFRFRIATVDEEGAFYGSVGKALKRFGIPVTESQEVAAQNAKLYDSIRASTPDLTVDILKVSENLYQISVVEFPATGNFFQSSLPLDFTAEQVVALLGEPNFKRKDGSVYIYSFFTSLKQLNIVWAGDKITKIQYITPNGI